MTKCHVCGEKTGLEHHYFFSGLTHLSRPKNKGPDREWQYFASLYHVYDPVSEQSIDFCSPECSTKFYVDKSVKVE